MSCNKQRLILLFDGTWNDPQDRTNVWRLSRHIEDYDGDIKQRFFYSEGVGTSRFTKIRGGAFGYGLSRNLQEGYDWLARRYSEGDEVYVFGFSRGAYTARSLVGMIHKCGLLHISTSGQLAEAEKLYRDKRASPNDSICEEFRNCYSREIPIHLLGVWDTVGALGIPGSSAFSEHGRYSWHDTGLSENVKRAYHAMALDEHRAAYDIVPWTNDGGRAKPEQIEVEQRWFIGAHANVGGGYKNDLLPDPPFAWMREKAEAAGLKLAPFTPDPKAYQANPNDSFREFLGGAYRQFRRVFHSGEGRHLRTYDRDHRGRAAVGVSVDASVWQRWQAVESYRPQLLVKAGLEPAKQAEAMELEPAAAE